MKNDHVPIKVRGATRSIFKGYVVLNICNIFPDFDNKKKVYLGKAENFKYGEYDNRDDSLICVSDDERVFKFLAAGGCAYPKDEFLKRYGLEEVWNEFSEIREKLLNEGFELSEIGKSLDLWERDFNSWQHELTPMPEEEEEPEME